MKKYLALFLAILCCGTLCITPAAAYNVDDVIISTTRIDLPDGGYIIEEITQTPTLARTSYTSGAKTSTRYTGSGHALFAVKVTGTFGYDGTTSWATSSTANVPVYDTGVTFISKTAWYSGNTAYAKGTVKYLGVTESKTTSLSCDKNGNLY